jgi:hypothetical protein
MPSTAFDRSSRVIALLLLLVSVWTSSHRQLDDDACLPVLAGEHDASKHAFTAPEVENDEHCAVCHWMRALKPAFTASGIVSTALAQADRLSVLALSAPVSPSSVRLPARAPPVALL